LVGLDLSVKHLESKHILVSLHEQPLQVLFILFIQVLRDRCHQWKIFHNSDFTSLWCFCRTDLI